MNAEEPRDAGWLAANLLLLAKSTLTAFGLDVYRRASPRFVPFSMLANQTEAGIFLPIDVPTPLRPEQVRKVSFGQTEVSLYNPLASPGPRWQPWPSPDHPAWWRRDDGALVPAWNIAGNLADLWASREDREITTRDRFGRLPINASPRFASGLTSVPTANEVVALLIDAAYHLERGSPPSMRPPKGLIAPPALALSHDCDILEGGDFWTQAARLGRIVSAARRGRLDHARISAVAENALFPRRYFLDDLRDMWKVEEASGFTSVAYILNGRLGRRYARNGFAAAAEVIQARGSGREIGIHYNWDTYLREQPFLSQKAEIEGALSGRVVMGRAHYLRFDPLVSPPFLHRMGIRLDESLGWAYAASFRGGTAGPFRPLGCDLIMLPLTLMDNVLLREGLAPFTRLLRHAEVVGGVLSVLVHPGMNENPEYPSLRGTYRAMLEQARNAGCRMLLRRELIGLAEQELQT